MVHKHRSPKSKFAKDVSPMRGMIVTKNLVLSTETQASAPRIPAEKWKYNVMVKDNRDLFNNLHFC